MNHFDHLFSPAFILKEDLTIDYFNPSMATLLQLPPRKIAKQKVTDLLSIDDFSWIELRDTCKEKGVAVSKEVDFSLDNQGYTYVFRIIFTDKGDYLCFTNDLSVEKGLHSKYRTQVNLLKQSHKQLVQADKVRAIGELTAGISHEINNPLTVASGNTELLGFALDNDNLNDHRDVIKDCVSNVDEALNRIQSIINGMKGFLHEGVEDKKEYINLSDVVTNSLKLTQSTLDSHSIKVSLNMPKVDAVVLGNQTRLEQVLINLIQNANDSLVEANTKKAEISITLKRDNKKHLYELCVKDNGVGVPQEIEESIFDSFFTTKDMGDGTGLGLSLCKKIAEDHQGDLVLESADLGAEFCLKLPVIEVSSFTSNEEFFSKINDVNGKKVLIVDNDISILNLCQKFLESTSFIFIGSTGGEEALEVLNKYDVDAVVTDLRMPGIDGAAFVKTLRESYGTIPVFYLSDAGGVDRYERDKVPLNLSGMLVKPFKSDDLINLLKNGFKDLDNL